MTLDQLTSHACDKATNSCISRLRELGWTDNEIAEQAEELAPRLRAEVQAVFDETFGDLLEGLKSAARNYAIVLFNLEFVLAGNRVAQAINGVKCGVVR
jgi:hypothetical protein